MSTAHAHRGGMPHQYENLSEASEDDNSLDFEAEKMINEAYSKLRLGTSRREEVDRKLHALHQQKLQQMANSKNECTFRPKINRASSVSEPMFDIPVEERLRRDAEMREARRQAAVHAKAQSKEATYSFKPQINHNSRRTASEMNPSKIPVEDRLMHYAEATEESRHMLAEQRRRQEDENMKQFFNPKIKDWKVDRDKDFFVRLEESEIKKKIAMEEQREEMSSAHSFKPQLSRISEAYVEGRRQLGWDNSMNRTDALYHEAKIRQQTQADRRAEVEAMENDPLMYKPSTSRLNDEILKSSKLKDLYGPTSFIERQQVFHELAKQHAKQLKRDVENDERRSGIKAKPSLPNTSQSTGCNLEYEDNEDKLDEAAIQDQVDRLYTQPRETSKTLKKVLAEKEINTKCPFKPTLAPATEEYWRVFAERNSGNNKGLDIFERLAAAPVKRIDQSQQQQGLNDSISVATEDEKKRRRISQGQVDEFYRKQLSGLQRKEQMLKKQKLLQEMEGQKDCTFHPDIQVRSTPIRRRGSSAPPPPSPHSRHNSSVCSTTSTVKEVMGVSSFMQRQESARRRRQEQEERVSQLGKGKQCNGPNYTVVTPFKLSNRSASAGSGLPNHRVTSNNQASEAGSQSTVVRKSIYRPQTASSSSFSQQRNKSHQYQDANSASTGHAYPYADPSRFAPRNPPTTTSNSVSPPRYGDIDASANISTMGFATNAPHPQDSTANTSVNPNLGNMETLSYNRDSAPVRRAVVRVSPALETTGGGGGDRKPQYVDATPQSATLLQAAMKRYLSAGVKKSLKAPTAM